MSTKRRNYTDEQRKAAQEFRDVILAIQWVLNTPEGKTFFKYLFKNLEVGILPPVGSEGNYLMDKIGFLRAGNSVFKIACEAAPEVAAELLAKLEKERYAELIAEQDLDGQS